MTGTDSLRLQYLEEQYEVLTTLGGNGAAPVFLVKDKRNGRIVVKKYVTVDAAILYSRLCGIRSPYLARIFETAWDGERGVIIEEYINGCTLKEYQQERGCLKPEEVFTMISGLCEALVLVHGHGIVHRDINPQNIMLSGDGIVKLIDFGIAREVKEEKRQDTAILGTVGYAAPEQFGFTQTDERTDIYALGVLMNVLLTGQLPGQQMYRDAPFGQIIQKCINMDPDKRFQSVTQLRVALGVSVDAPSPVQEGGGNGAKHKEKCNGCKFAGVPGFRTGVVWKNTVAGVGYGFMVLMTIIQLSVCMESAGAFWLELMATLLYLWGAALVMANVADWDKRLFPFCKFPTPLRIIIRIFLCFWLVYWGLALDSYVKYDLLGLPHP